MKKLFTLTFLFAFALLASCGAKNINPSSTSGDPSVISSQPSSSSTTSGDPSSISSQPSSSSVTSSSSQPLVVNVTGISMTVNQATVKVGKTYNIYATVSPYNATNKNVIWSSSDETVATVTKDSQYLEILDVRGLITTIKPGTTTITATTEDGGFAASCVLTVEDVIRVKGISLNKTSTTLEKGKTETLYKTFDPRNPENSNVTWTSSDESIATVSNSGVVTGIEAGEATITVTTEDGGFTAECKVTVLPEVVATYSLGETKLEILQGSVNKSYRISTPFTNTGNVNLYISNFSYDIETQDGTPVDAISTYNVDSRPDIVEPGETITISAFYTYDSSYTVDELVAKPNATVKNAKNYDSKRLEVSHVSVSMESFFGPKVLCKVKNTLDEECDMIYVVFNIYDVDGNFLLKGYSIDMNTLAVGGEKTFSITSLDGIYCRDIDLNTIRVEVIAYEHQYVIIL